MLINVGTYVTGIVTVNKSIDSSFLTIAIYIYDIHNNRLANQAKFFK